MTTTAPRATEKRATLVRVTNTATTAWADPASSAHRVMRQPCARAEAKAAARSTGADCTAVKANTELHQ